MSYKIEDLRNMLFVTMENLLDKQNPLDLDRAKVIGELGQVIVNSAKVESDDLKVIGGGQSHFIDVDTTKKLN